MTTWQPTRRDLRNFLRDVAQNPGKTYYAVSECAQPWGNENKYREIKFKPSRLWVGTWGHHSAEAVLSNYGPITDVKPGNNMKGLFERGEQHLPDQQKVAESASRFSRKLAGRR